MPVPALGTLLPNLPKPSAGGDIVCPLSALASIPKLPKPLKNPIGCIEVGPAMLATKQAMLTLVPTRSGKSLHENKKVWQQHWSTSSQGGTSGKDVASSLTLNTKDYSHSSAVAKQSW